MAVPRSGQHMFIHAIKSAIIIYKYLVQATGLHLGKKVPSWHW